VFHRFGCSMAIGETIVRNPKIFDYMKARRKLFAEYNYPKYRYYRVVDDQSVNIYGEATSSRRYDPAILLPFLFKVDDDRDFMEAYGLDSMRVGKATMEKAVLEALPNPFVPMIGDRILFEGLEWEILTVAGGAYLIGDNNFLVWECRATWTRDFLASTESERG